MASEPRTVSILVDGRPVQAPRGATVAAVLAGLENGVVGVPRRGEPRGPLCAMGSCFECRAHVDGRPMQRTCLIAVREGMRVERIPGLPARAVGDAAVTRERADVLVVGGGPAGVAAAVSAAEGGADVLVVDENPALGGQIWRAEREGERPPPARTWLARAADLGVRTLSSTTVIHAAGARHLVARTPAGIAHLHGQRVVLATGARELFLPFPGWTLPGVVGAGGIQALVKSGLDVRGRRVAVCGSGPLLLVVAAFLVRHGADVVGLVESVPRRRLVGAAAGLLFHPGRLAAAVRSLSALSGVRKFFGARTVRAEGSERVERVVIERGARSQALACDWLACSFGLVPETTVAEAIGCELRDEALVVDEWQRTSVPGVFAAGETAGVAGVDAALVEGRIAGLCAADRQDAASELFGWRARAHKSARRLLAAFGPAKFPEPAEDTIVCRCEAVTWGAIAGHDDGRRVRLETRCGMGPCQARVCGPAVRRLAGLSLRSVRPPFVPVPLGWLRHLGGE